MFVERVVESGGTAARVRESRHALAGNHGSADGLPQLTAHVMCLLAMTTEEDVCWMKEAKCISRRHEGTFLEGELVAIAEGDQEPVWLWRTSTVLR